MEARGCAFLISRYYGTQKGPSSLPAPGTPARHSFPRLGGRMAPLSRLIGLFVSKACQGQSDKAQFRRGSIRNRTLECFVRPRTSVRGTLWSFGAPRGMESGPDE